MLIGIIIVILLVYFLIIRPLAQRNNQSQYPNGRGYYDSRSGRFDDSRGYYDDNRGRFDDRRGYFDNQRGYFDRPDPFGAPRPGGGIGRFGSFAGGIAAGALLTYLFEQGRVGYDQYQAWQGLDDQGIMRQLMDQNILQDHEIAQLQDEVDRGNGNSWNPNDTGNYQDNNYDYDHDNDYDDPNNPQDYDGLDQNNNNNDNWV